MCLLFAVVSPCPKATGRGTQISSRGEIRLARHAEQMVRRCGGPFNGRDIVLDKLRKATTASVEAIVFGSPVVLLVVRRAERYRREESFILCGTCA